MVIIKISKEQIQIHMTTSHGGKGQSQQEKIVSFGVREHYQVERAKAKGTRENKPM